MIFFILLSTRVTLFLHAIITYKKIIHATQLFCIFNHLLFKRKRVPIKVHAYIIWFYLWPNINFLQVILNRISSYIEDWAYFWAIWAVRNYSTYEVHVHVHVICFNQGHPSWDWWNCIFPRIHFFWLDKQKKNTLFQLNLIIY